MSGRPPFDKNVAEQAKHVAQWVFTEGRDGDLTDVEVSQALILAGTLGMLHTSSDAAQNVQLAMYTMIGALVHQGKSDEVASVLGQHLKVMVGDAGPDAIVALLKAAGAKVQVMKGPPPPGIFGQDDDERDDDAFPWLPKGGGS